MLGTIDLEETGAKMRYDKIIIGAGLYGLYSALFCLRRGESVLVLECDEKPFSRATYINQARVHGGYIIQGQFQLLSNQQDILKE